MVVVNQTMGFSEMFCIIGWVAIAFSKVFFTYLLLMPEFH